MLADFGENLPDSARMVFEHQVKPIRGRGKASHTDLLISWEKGAIGIEAKWTEREYETVAKWLGPKPSENRRRVLAGWCELLSQCSNRSIKSEDVDQMPYQLVHRAASVCAQEVLARYVVYEVFFELSNEMHNYYLAQLQALRRLTLPGKLRIALLKVKLKKTDAFESLARGGPEDRLALIVEELHGDENRGQDLLLFDRPKLTIIE